jgi:hypothetical protein
MFVAPLPPNSRFQCVLILFSMRVACSRSNRTSRTAPKCTSAARKCPLVRARPNNPIGVSNPFLLCCAVLCCAVLCCAALTDSIGPERGASDLEGYRVMHIDRIEMDGGDVLRPDGTTPEEQWSLAKLLAMQGKRRLVVVG